MTRDLLTSLTALGHIVLTLHRQPAPQGLLKPTHQFRHQPHSLLQTRVTTGAHDSRMRQQPCVITTLLNPLSGRCHACTAKKNSKIDVSTQPEKAPNCPAESHTTVLPTLPHIQKAMVFAVRTVYESKTGQCAWRRITGDLWGV